LTSCMTLSLVDESFAVSTGVLEITFTASILILGCVFDTVVTFVGLRSGAAVADSVTISEEDSTSVAAIAGLTCATSLWVPEGV